MAYYNNNTLAKWLADHLGADWLHLSAPSQLPDDTKLVVTITIRFGNKYCRIRKAYEYRLMADVLEELKRARDEFFLLGRNVLPYDEGCFFEEEVKNHGL